MATCGLWLTPSCLWATVVDDEGKPLGSSRIAHTDDARWNFLAHLDAHHGLDCGLILTDEHARSDGIGRFALQRKMVVWLAPWPTVDAVRLITGMATGPPRRTAAALARMQLHPLFRVQLRRLERDRRQLSLL